MSDWTKTVCPFDSCPWGLPRGHVVGDHPSPNEWADPRTTFSPLRIGQTLVNSIKEGDPSIFYMEDHDLMLRLGARRERDEVCAECENPIYLSHLCSYGCKYDGLPAKPTKEMVRWVLPWEETNG